MEFQQFVTWSPACNTQLQYLWKKSPQKCQKVRICETLQQLKRLEGKCRLACIVWHNGVKKRLKSHSIQQPTRWFSFLWSRSDRRCSKGPFKYYDSKEVGKMFRFLNQCFARLRFCKSVSDSRNLLDGATAVLLETLFQNRSRAKHWFKNLNILISNFK